MGDYYLSSVNQNKAFVCEVCEEITWVRGEEFLSLDRVFHVCHICEGDLLPVILSLEVE